MKQFFERKLCIFLFEELYSIYHNAGTTCFYIKKKKKTHFIADILLSFETN